ncbi:hypothetical protein BGZ83_007191 [Gryganskiella cystojenkinii]|nr:hypothetical protein BGZ83_007191 [Gryganskiella cystojenkinii]
MNIKFYLGLLSVISAAAATCTREAATSMPYDIQVFENDDCSGRTWHIQCDYDHEAVGDTWTQPPAASRFLYNSVLIGTKYAVTLYDVNYVVSPGQYWGQSSSYYFQYGKVPTGKQFVIWCHGSE